MKKQGENRTSTMMSSETRSVSLGIDDQQLPRLTPTTANIDDQADFAAAKTSTKKKNPKRLKVVKF